MGQVAQETPAIEHEEVYHASGAVSRKAKRLDTAPLA